MKLVIAEKDKQIKNIKKLYYKAFPQNEQKPFSLILEKKEKGFVEMYCLENKLGVFYGFAICLKYKNYILLDYLAISENFRNLGAGSEILQNLKQKYEHQNFFLEIERIKNNIPNKTTRQRRKTFYLKNKMLETGIFIDLLGVEMELLANNKNISFEEYFNLYSNIFDQNICNRIHQIK